MTNPFFLCYLFIVGTAIGSFLNVVVDRLYLGESIVTGRSYCDSCKRTISWRDLIPVVSYLLLRGKCRTCKEQIGLYYPAVEIVTGLLFVAAAMGATGISELLFFLVIESTLVVIFFADMKYGIIPFPAIIIGALTSILHILFVYPENILSAILSGLGAGIFFLVIYLATRGKGMGLGDVVYAFYMGFLLGYPAIIAGLYISFLTGALVSLILIFRGKKRLRGSTIPFGPFLVFGTLLSLLFQEEMIRLITTYLHL